MKTLKGKIIIGVMAIMIVGMIGVNSMIAYLLNHNLGYTVTNDLEKIKTVVEARLEKYIDEDKLYKDQILPTLSTLSRTYETYIALEGDRQLFSGKQIHKETIEKLLEESKKTSAIIYMGRTPEGYHGTYGYPLYKDKSYQGTLVVQKDYTSVYKDAQKMMSQIIGIEIIIASLMVGGMYHWLRKTTVGLGVLERAMEKVKDGNFREAVSLEGEDEVVRLAEAFNTMQYKIQQQMQALIEEKEKVEALEQESKSFFNYATHEIKTPLTAIKGYSELLSTGEVDAERVQSMASRIGIETDRLYKLVENMLIVARGQQVATTQEEVDLQKLVASCIKDYEVILDKEEKRVECRMMPATIWASKEELRIVWKNLLDNAIKYSTTADIQVSLEVKGNIMLSLSNQLGELPEKLQGELLQPFTKYQYGDYQKVSSGLGLFICKELIEKNNGVLDYTIQEGVITFTLTFEKA
ncbi:MAG: histidine kinase dimerization/phospho-acceptor domain-containing protein [Cellulosilyticaceae bacterium]